MDLFHKSLSEAISKNETEALKWEKYLEEMRQAESSLRDFQKKLEVECMVPIGTKALMPGYLYHTSEILVGNGNKIFSKCTTFEALKICKHRQKFAEDRLNDLRTEHDLHKNKLELPFMQNAFGNQGQEIIEEYDEAKEAEWREKHRKSVADQKRQERELREKKEVEKTHDEVMNHLDELELMDELESELESLEVHTDDELRQLMAGQIQLPQGKQRMSHLKRDVIVDGRLAPVEMRQQEMPQNEVLPEPVDEVPPEVDSPPDEGNYTGESESDSNSDIDSSTVSPQVYSKWREMFEQSKTLKRADKRRYLRQKMKDVQISLNELVVHDVDTLTTRIDLNDLKDLIEDELIRLQINKSLDEDADPSLEEAPTHTPTKRRSKISFAQEDHVKLIDKFEAPCMVSDSSIQPEPSPADFLTRQIKFTHSEWPVMEPCKVDEDEIGSPTDIYNERFGYFPKDDLPVPILDVPSLESSCEDLKSILKNKEKVLQETHVEVPVEKKVKKERKAKKLAQATNLLGDVIERPVDYEPTSKEKGDHTSYSSGKTKVSKFKANRNKNKS